MSPLPSATSDTNKIDQATVYKTPNEVVTYPPLRPWTMTFWFRKKYTI